MKNDVKLHCVIINGAPRERSITDYTDKGYVHLATKLATEFHPYAVATDHILFFAKPIDKEAYDAEMAEWRKNEIPTANVPVSPPRDMFNALGLPTHLLEVDPHPNYAAAKEGLKSNQMHAAPSTEPAAATKDTMAMMDNKIRNEIHDATIHFVGSPEPPVDKVFCVECGEDCEYELGRMVTISDIDGSKGHWWCIEKYDKRKKNEIDNP